MIGYLARRVAQAVVALWVVVTVVFVLMKLMPGSLARIVLGPRHAYPAAIAEFNRANGLDRPVVVQYGRFLDSLLHGQLTFAPPHVHVASLYIAGYAHGVSLRQLAQVPLENTLILMGLSLAAAVPLGMAAGTWLALRRGPRLGRNAVRIGAGVLYLIPSFFLAVLLVQLLAVTFPLLPLNVLPWLQGDVLSEPAGLVLPALTLALGNAALITRFAESSAVECLQQDYVTTARAKGAGVAGVVWRHVLRNSAVTMLTVLQTRFATMLSIGLPVEVAFSYPGIELLAWNAATNKDAYTVLGATLLVGCVVLAASLLVDVLYLAVDPRIRYA